MCNYDSAGSDTGTFVYLMQIWTAFAIPLLIFYLVTTKMSIRGALLFLDLIPKKFRFLCLYVSALVANIFQNLILIALVKSYPGAYESRAFRISEQLISFYSLSTLVIMLVKTKRSDDRFHKGRSGSAVSVGMQDLPTAKKDQSVNDSWFTEKSMDQDDEMKNVFKANFN